MANFILISNRLPVTIEKRKEKLYYKPSVGGLATGLSSFIESDNTKWIGWCGLTSNSMDVNTRHSIENELVDHYHCYPIFLSKNDMRLFYSGFCNRTIWPLFHYFIDYVHYDSELWDAYVRVNKLFAQKIQSIMKPDDTLWIHDYHLMLVPQMIREKSPDAQIGFFLHIPFPSYEVFRLLPKRKEILQGLLGSDLVGFHTYDYARHFSSSVRRILGYDQTFGQVSHNHQLTRVDAFPMGIEYERFVNADPNIDWIQNFLNQCQLEGSCKIILSVDRLDYTKGIPNRLEAYDRFLEKYREYREKVTLILVTVPSRTTVESYQQLKNHVDSLVGRINGKYGTMDWMPVWYFYRYMDFNHLTALYQIADIAMITPIRDGMNLIAKEYIASRKDNKGVLILSETAGAVSELAEAIVVNPNNKEEVCDALQEAMILPESIRIERNLVMRERIERYNVVAWAKDFMDRLAHIKHVQLDFGAKILTTDSCRQLTKSYKKAKKRLIFLDYDGTLVPFASTPDGAKPDKKLGKLLSDLTADPKNHVVIISGRDRQTLDKWLGQHKIGMSAEHGVWIKELYGEWHMLVPLHDKWKEEIRPILELYLNRTPGALIEEKTFSLVWHYRKADPGLGVERAMELKEALLGLTANLQLTVSEGNKVLEVKFGSVDKGRASLFWTANTEWDFIAAFGDDWTDEDLFKALPAHAYSIKVGMSSSNAQYFLKTQAEVRDLLELLIQKESKIK